MGSGISSSRQKAADQTEVSESVVGQSLASVLPDTDGQTADGSERLQYPQNVHAAFDVERYVVDENGLRYRDPHPKVYKCNSFLFLEANIARAGDVLPSFYIVQLHCCVVPVD